MPTARIAQQKSPIIRNLTGGLNLRESITDLADNENIASSNLVYYTAGDIARRGGWKKLFSNSPTTNALLGIYQAIFNSAGVFSSYIVVTDGTNIWQTTTPSVSGNAATWTQITGAATLDATQPYHFLMMTNKLVIFNGIAAFYWTGSGNLTAFALPTGVYAALTVGDILITAVASYSTVHTFKYTAEAVAGARGVSVVFHAPNTP